MSDKLILVAMICITALGITAIVVVGTYFKDKLSMKNRLNVKNLIDSEVAITAEDKNKNSKK